MTGAIRWSPAITFGEPISPAWKICATPARGASTSGRSSPWVSEMIPILSTAPASLVLAVPKTCASRSPQVITTLDVILGLHRSSEKVHFGERLDFEEVPIRQPDRQHGTLR